MPCFLTNTRYYMYVCQIGIIRHILFHHIKGLGIPIAYMFCPTISLGHLMIMLVLTLPYSLKRIDLVIVLGRLNSPISKLMNLTYSHTEKNRRKEEKINCISM